MPKISIIIAVYNVEKYLKQCLDSLVNQTLQDIEIIFTDDGSTDNSLNILKEYRQKDNRIKIIEQENQGPGIARNNALDIATGKYIMIVDPDDWLELDACELAYNQIEQNQNDLVIFDYKRFDETSGKFIDDGDKFYPYKDCIDNPHINVAEQKENFIQNAFAWQKIYNKKFLDNNSIRFLPKYLGEDAPFAALSIMQSTDISILNKPLYNYRVRSNSASYDTERWNEHVSSKIFVLDYVISNNFKKNIISKYLEYLFNSLKFWYKIYADMDSAVKKEYKNRMFACFNQNYDYMSTKTKFRYNLFKYNLEGLYYKLIRPIGKYCIVLPYRKIRAALQGK